MGVMHQDLIDRLNAIIAQAMDDSVRVEGEFAVSDQERADHERHRTEAEAVRDEIIAILKSLPQT